MGNNAAADDLPLAGVYVVFVDDNVDARDIVKSYLEYHGAVVRAAPSAHAALEILERATPDLLITDLSMPARNGMWLLNEVRKRPGGFTLPVVALTAHHGWYAREAMLRAGFDAYLTKPVSSAKLSRTVARFSGR